MNREHPDPEVRAALIRLSDALCQWERETGRESVLILREVGGYSYRAQNGKPGIPDDVPDQYLFEMIEG
jgi:hypothetical protein